MAKGQGAMKINDPEQIPIEHWRPGVETRMLVSARNGATQLCMFEQWVAPGNGAPTHSHPVEEVLTENWWKTDPPNPRHQSPNVIRASSSFSRCRSAESLD